ncbi:uncharacterized protein BJ171DRAFT_30077 [Polychytrium aggregatum]|uniref:uncharacterized protein n=1 Tax=Polychytrium aggregatum TaxID=110093 RepID=UPI0022FEC2EE|nr:uncharacterized protein BJ171DRAFT_30077 [Polychytrium aggregatum]KAI9206415.1 hypothetical protein BJ171DRAFT_30077 [Polychytrium aggregatum]
MAASNFNWSLGPLIQVTDIGIRQAAASSSTATQTNAQTSPTMPASPSLSGAGTPNGDTEPPERRCWICFVEDSEENSGAPVSWVHPCKCKSSLKYAHEACLLKWIAEKQGTRRTQVSCPACGHPYKIVEPSSSVLNVMKFFDGAIQRSIPFITMAGLSVALYTVSTTFGAYCVMVVCGPEVGDEVLGAERWGWRTWVGLPLVPFALVSSRWKSADAVLPLLPFVILGSDRVHITFPPSPALTICLMPWARLLYNHLHESILKLIHHRPDTKSQRRLSQSERVRQTLDDANPEQPEEDAAAEEAVPELRRDGQRVVVGALLLPICAAICGGILGELGLRKYVGNSFYRNIIGGCVFIVSKDVTTEIYKYYLRKQRRSRRIANLD